MTRFLSEQDKKGIGTLSNLRRAGKNIFYKAIAEILSRFIYLFFFIYMARHLGSSDFGLFSFAFSFVGIFVLLVDPGLNILLTRDVARDRSLAPKYSNNIFTVKLILSIITLFLLWIALILLGYDQYTITVVLVMGIYLVLNSFFEFFIALSNAYERMDIDAAIKVTNKVLVSLLGFVALIVGGRIISMMSCMVLASFIAIIISYHYIKKGVISIDIELDRKALRSMLYKAFPMALTSIFALVYFKVDVVMLSMFGSSNSDIGIYSAAIRLIEVLNVIPAILVGGLFPIMADLSKDRKSELESTFKKSFQVLLLIVIFLVVVTVTSSHDIIRIIYGVEYSKSTVALNIIIWTSLFIFPNVLFLNLIVIANKQVLNAIFAFICLMVNVLLNLFFIPRYGYIGASIATVVTDMIFFSMTAAFAVHYFSSYQVLLDGLKPLLCGVLLALVLLAIKGSGLIIILLTAVVSYVLFILATKILSVKDLKQFKETLIRS
jgi:O-antigen/teichoic acid export membrane protein